MNPKRNQTRLRAACLAIAGLALLATGGHAGATDRRGERPVESIESRAAGEPFLAIVSLRNQRITIYDANGWILRAPVSSGQRDRETPAGIFSVIQKDADHHSNLYDDAFMPHMQRITWSGIALHGGPLPGYPASHGCVRMPFDFAARLFEMTRMGLRVIVAPTDVAPIEIAHPVLFQPKPGDGVVAAALIAAADEATRKAAQARLAAGTAFRESIQGTVPVRVAENLKLRTERQLAAAETAIGAAISVEAKEQAERDKADAIDRIAALQLQLAGAKAELQPKLDAVTRTREAAVIADYDPLTVVERELVLRLASLLWRLRRASAIETVRLLLNSKSPQHPDGLANSSGLVGKNLMFHPYAMITGIFPEPVHGRAGPSGCSFWSHEFYKSDPSRGFLRGYSFEAVRGFGPSQTALWGMAQGRVPWGEDHHREYARLFNRTGTLMAITEDLPEETNTVTLDPELTDSDGIPAPKVTYRLSENSRKQLAHGVERATEAFIAAGAVDTVADPLLRTAGWHLMGTARMGRDPEASVVNEWGRAHDVKNLFIVDGSIFVTAGAVNPTSTIQALALYVADSIKKNIGTLFEE